MNGVHDIEALNRRLRYNHFSVWLDLTVVQAGDGEIEIRAPWRPEIVSNPDGRFTHGGILGTLIDTAAALSIRTVTDNLVRTVDMRVDYHSVARECDLLVRGKVLKVGRRIASSEAWIYTPDGTLAASGRATFIVLDEVRHEPEAIEQS
jgi:uncharacterized protein (TIGR00369 family)